MYFKTLYVKQSYKAIYPAVATKLLQLSEKINTYWYKINKENT